MNLICLTESMDTESEAGDCDDEEALFKTYLHLRQTARSDYFNVSETL